MHVSANKKLLSIRLAWLAVLCISAPAFAAPEARRKAVLAIYAQEHNTPAFSGVDDGIRKALRDASPEGVTYYSEFLDSFRFSGDRYVQVMRDYLQQRYEGRQVDAVIVVGDMAAQTILDPHEPLFSDVPVLFFNAERFAPKLPDRWVSVPGLASQDHRQTVSLALALHPATEQIFVVVPTRLGAPVYETNVRRQLAEFENRVRIEYLTNISTRDLIANLSHAPHQSLVLYIGQDEDLAGERAFPRDVLPLLAESATVPIYGGYDSHVGYGIVGGYVFNGEANGAALASLALRLAKGERARDITVALPAPVPMFDERQLRAWKIRDSQLPAGSVILFREPTFWAHYGRYAIGGLSIFIIQFSLIGMLLAQRVRRRRAERGLRHSEECYRLVVQSQSDLICRFLPDSTLTLVNDAYCRFRGKTSERLIGTKILDGIPDHLRAPIARHFASMATPPHSGRHEVAVQRADGSVGWHEWITHAQIDPNGRVRELLGTGRDITDRKRAEEALRNSEARNGAMLRAMPDLMFVMSREGVYLDYHARDPRDLWAPPEQFLGKTVSEIMPPELSTIFGPAIAKADMAEPIVVEYALPLPGGHRFFEARIVGSESGQVVSIVREVTAQKMAAARLQTSEDRYALATSAGGVGVWDWNVETGEIYVDPEVLRLLGFAESDAASHGPDWKRMVHPHDLKRVTAAAYAYLDGRTPKYDLELRMLHRDGSARWFHARGSVSRRPDGVPYRMVGTYTDVTDRKRVEEMLREHETVLRANNAEIRYLAGRLIEGQETERKRLARELHDELSQNVSLLAIDIDQLRQETAPQGFIRMRRISQYIADIATEVHNLSHRLHPFKLEALGLVAAIKGVCTDLSTQHGVAIEFEHDGVPADLRPDVALCLFRIAQEALRNVVKHSGEKRARLRVAREGPDLALQIADSGIGFVLDAPDRAGLGLVSMRERVHFLGGQLVIHTAPGSGTRIGVRVPLEPLETESASSIADSVS